MIRKFNELFDTEDLKAKFEIPYLSDEEGFVKSFNKSMLDPTMTYVNAILTEYPILESSFNIGTFDTEFGKAVFIFSESKKPVDGKTFYVQLSLQSFDKNDYIGGVLIADKTTGDQEDRYYEFDSFKESLKVVQLFLGVCEQLQVIEKKPSVLN